MFPSQATGALEQRACVYLRIWAQNDMETPEAAWVPGHDILVSRDQALASCGGLVRFHSPAGNPFILYFGVAVGGFPWASVRQAGGEEGIRGEVYPLPLHHWTSTLAVR